MSTPSGQPSTTLRAVGVGLVAVALVLGAVGVLANNQDSPSPAADGVPTSTSAAPGTATTSSAGPAPTSGVTGPAGSATATGPTSGVTGPSGGATATGPSGGATATGPSGGATAAPSTTPGSPGSAAGGSTTGGSSSGPTGSVDLGVPVRVLNNSTTTGLAADAAARLERSGWRDVSVGNYPQGIIPTTTVYYRPGTAEQPAAQQIATALGARAQQRFDGLDVASPGVVLIVTSDFRG